MNIPFFSPAPMHAVVDAEINAFWGKFYQSNWYILGPELEQFEQAYADFNQTKYCVGVANGLDALHIALKALGIGPGDEVIVPSNTYIATALAVTYIGATPIFVEPDINTYNINPKNIEAAITSTEFIPRASYPNTSPVSIRFILASILSVTFIISNKDIKCQVYSEFYLFNSIVSAVRTQLKISIMV